MAKAYILQATYDAFGRVILPEVLGFIEDDMEPDEIYQPERLLECLLDHHRDLLDEEFERWKEES